MVKRSSVPSLGPMQYIVCCRRELINTSCLRFLKSRSSSTNLLCFFEEISRNVDELPPIIPDGFYKDSYLNMQTDNCSSLDRTMAYWQSRIVADGEISN